MKVEPKAAEKADEKVADWLVVLLDAQMVDHSVVRKVERSADVMTVLWVQ